MIETAEAVEEACLSGTVGTDDRENLAVPDVEADIVESMNIAEG